MVARAASRISVQNAFVPPFDFVSLNGQLRGS